MDDEQPQAPTMAQVAIDCFTGMAEKVGVNQSADFAGAFAVIPPDGEPIELLLINNKPNPAVFWGLLKTHAEMALGEIAEKERQRSGWS